jgi:hypothetical protein
VWRWCRAARVDPTLFSGHSLRAGFVTSALADGADLFKVLDVTRHREVKTLKAHDRRAKEFREPLFLFVFPSEITLFPDVGPAFAAAGLSRAFLECEMVAERVVLRRRRMIEQPAKVDEVLLRGRAFSQSDRLPFADEILRRHRGGQGLRGACVRLA